MVGPQIAIDAWKQHLTCWNAHAECIYIPKWKVDLLTCMHAAKTQNNSIQSQTVFRLFCDQLTDRLHPYLHLDACVSQQRLFLVGTWRTRKSVCAICWYLTCDKQMCPTTNCLKLALRVPSVIFGTCRVNACVWGEDGLQFFFNFTGPLQTQYSNRGQILDCKHFTLPNKSEHYKCFLVNVHSSVALPLHSSSNSDSTSLWTQAREQYSDSLDAKYETKCNISAVKKNLLNSLWYSVSMLHMLLIYRFSAPHYIIDVMPLLNYYIFLIHTKSVVQQFPFTKDLRTHIPRSLSESRCLAFHDVTSDKIVYC